MKELTVKNWDEVPLNYVGPARRGFFAGKSKSTFEYRYYSKIYSNQDYFSLGATGIGWSNNEEFWKNLYAQYGDLGNIGLTEYILSNILGSHNA